MFYAALEIQGTKDISESGGLGAYDLRPRRLVELKYARGLRLVRTPSNRQVYECQFILPWTQERFLADPFAQHAALTKSMQMYYAALQSGELARPKGASVAGALAVLHRGGRGALSAFPALFEETRALYEKTKELF